MLLEVNTDDSMTMHKLNQKSAHKALAPLLLLTMYYQPSTITCHSREQVVLGLEKLTWETITTISLTMHMANKIPKE